MLFVPTIGLVVLLCALAGTDAMHWDDSDERDSHEKPYRYPKFDDSHLCVGCDHDYEELYPTKVRQRYYQFGQWGNDHGGMYPKNVPRPIYYKHQWVNDHPNDFRLTGGYEYDDMNQWNEECCPEEIPEHFEPPEKEDIWAVYKELFVGALNGGEGLENYIALLMENANKEKNKEVTAIQDRVAKATTEGKFIKILQEIENDITEEEMNELALSAAKGLDVNTTRGAVEFTVRFYKGLLDWKSLTAEDFADAYIKDLKRLITDDELRMVLKHEGFDV